MKYNDWLRENYDEIQQRQVTPKLNPLEIMC